MKKILVVSNNPFSRTENNGKTLLSFFKDFPSENIAQLYFQDIEFPEELNYLNYKITDREMLPFKRKQLIIKKNFLEKNYNSKIKKSELLRILREIIWWQGKWRNRKLDLWIEKFKPEYIFFCAGDSGFSYSVVEYLSKKYGLKIMVYITDDYILPRKTINLFWWIRRNYILSKMKKMIKKSKEFFVVSPQMQKEYSEIFNKKGNILINIPENIISMDKIEKKEFREIKLVYMGGFHYGRDEVLLEVAKVIETINLKNNLNIKFEIFSTQKLSTKKLVEFNKYKSSYFNGSLSKEEVDKKLKEDIILLHVESFNKSYVEKTRLSLSTKIPEYLSSGNPIIAIGPSEIASMKFLEGTAFCIYKREQLEEKISLLIDDRKLKQLSERSYFKFLELKNILERSKEKLRK